MALFIEVARGGHISHRISRWVN